MEIDFKEIFKSFDDEKLNRTMDQLKEQLKILEQIKSDRK